MRNSIIWWQNLTPPRPLGHTLYFFEKGDPNQDDLRKRAEIDFGIEIQTPEAVPKDPAKRPLGALQAADFAVWNFRNVVRKKQAGILDEYREDFKLLFSRVPSYPHHVHFSMDVYPRRLRDDPPELVSIRNEDEKSDEASLVRFCQERKIPLRPNTNLWKKSEGTRPEGFGSPMRTYLRLPLFVNCGAAVVTSFCRGRIQHSAFVALEGEV
jgi:hypothetical protein